MILLSRDVFFQVLSSTLIDTETFLNMALAASTSCDFCQNVAPEFEKGRLVKFESVDIVAHSKCLQYSANIYRDEDGSWDPELVAKELKRVFMLRCDLCREKGKNGALLKGAGCGCAYFRYSWFPFDNLLSMC